MAMAGIELCDSGGSRLSVQPDEAWRCHVGLWPHFAALMEGHVAVKFRQNSAEP